MLSRVKTLEGLYLSTPLETDPQKFRPRVELQAEMTRLRAIDAVCTQRVSELMNFWMMNTFEWRILLCDVVCLYLYILVSAQCVFININKFIDINNMCIQSSMNGIGEESMNGIGEEMKGGRESIDKESCIHNCHHPEGWNQVDKLIIDKKVSKKSYLKS